MAEQRELVKVLAQAVVLRRDGDRIVGEAVSDPQACYSQEELTSWWGKAELEVQAFNEAQPNRAARRKGKP